MDDTEELSVEDKLLRLEDLSSNINKPKPIKTKNLLVRDGVGGFLMVTRKLLWHIHIVGLGIAFVDVFLEGQKYSKIGKAMDKRVDGVEKDLKHRLLDMRLADIKIKFCAIRNAFKLVLEGDDKFEVRRSRLDSIFLICEEMQILISDEQSELLENAECCIDLIASFIVTHIGMIRVGQEMFKLNDYNKKLIFLLDYYPILMRSYIDKAIGNYVTPIILNYHNQYNKTQEVEEVFYERTGRVLYQRKNDLDHTIWKTT